MKRAIHEKRLRGEKKRIDQKQRHAQRLLANILDNSAEAIVAVNGQYDIIVFNRAAEGMFGFHANEILGRSLDLLIPERLVEIHRQHVRDFVASTARGMPMEHRTDLTARRKDGSVFPVMIGLSKVVEDGEALYTAMVVDIAERKRAEEDLRQSEAKYRDLVENINDVIFVVDENGVFSYISPIIERASGYTPNEMIGRPFAEFIYPEDLVAVRTNFRKVLAQQLEPLEYRVRTKSGQVIWVRSSSRANVIDQRVVGLTGVLTDISARKRAELALQQNEKRFRALIEHNADAIILTDRAGIILYASPSASNILGTPAGGLIGLNGFHGIHPDDAPRLMQLLGELVQKPGATAPFEARFQHPDGSWRWIEGTGTNLLEEPGVRALVGNYRDITERKKAQQEIERLLDETRLRANQLGSVYDAGLALNSMLEPRPLLEFLFKIATRGLHADRAEFFRYDPTSNDLRFEMGIGHPPSVLAVLEDTVLTAGDECDIAGWVSKYRVPLNVPDVSADARWHGTFDPEIRSGIWVSVEHENKLLGILGVLSEGPNAFSPMDERLLVLFANQAAVALENARLYDETRQRVAELEAVNKISTALRMSQSLDEMLPRLFDEILDVLSTNLGGLWLYDSERDELALALARGWAATVPSFSKRGQGIIGHVWETGELYYVKEFKSDPHVYQPTQVQIPEGAGGAFVPIRAGNDFSGILFVGVVLPRTLTPGEVNLLTIVAEITGSAIHRMWLHEQTEQQVQRLGALRAIDMAISNSVDLCVTLNILLEQVVTQLHVDAACVLRFNPHGHTLDYAAGRGFRTKGIERSRLRLGEGVSGRAALERRLIAIPKIEDSVVPFGEPHLLIGEGFVSQYSMPLVAKGQVIGVLEIFQRAPFAPLPEWIEFLEALARQAAIAIDNASLFQNLQRSNNELTLAYDSTIEGWSRALDLRDKETEGHTERVTELTLRLARSFGLGEAELAHIRRGALLHDIGKMGIPDHILLKPDPLTQDEWAVMREHPNTAYELLAPIEYLKPVLDIPYCHHEKWNGTGYPRGLMGEQILLAARIFSVADVWDALCSNRPYRAAMSKSEALGYIREQSGKHFDPAVVELFLRIMTEV